MTDINFNIDDVSRELFKEGKIIKISARSGEKHDRYLYLVSAASIFSVNFFFRLNVFLWF